MTSHRNSGWRKPSLVLVLLVSLAALVAGCGSSSGSSSSSTTSSGSGDESGSASGKTVFLVGSGDVGPWAKANNHAVIDALEAAGAQVTYLQDPYNTQLQVENLNRAVAAKPALIMLLADEFRAVVPALNRAKAAGIPVINMSEPPGIIAPYIAASQQANHEQLGTFAAENIIEGLKEEGKTSGNVIAITGTSGMYQVELRMKAFEKKLAEVPGLKIVAVEDGNWDENTSQKIAQQLFAKYQGSGGIQAAYGMADNQAVGIIQAAKESGMPVGVKDKGLIVTGSNCYRIGLESIKRGEQFGTASQSPVEEGEAAGKLGVELLEGKSIAKEIEGKETRITSKNVDEWLAKNVCP
ncbi:MAG: sugar ABC transporter substrate-binding protein [Actinobacteria bacterium]|nr:sugar ABC transporter substrate-binding protein [Actinomycetota bacterium]